MARPGAALVATEAGLASTAGLIASYLVDFPSCPAIVCSLGLFLLLYGGWRVVRPAGAKNEEICQGGARGT